MDHIPPLLERLKLEPTSVWRAKSLNDDGKFEHFGWSKDSYLLASLIDAVNKQGKGKKLKESERVALPKVVKPKGKRKKKFDPHSGVKNMHLGRLFPDGV